MNGTKYTHKITKQQIIITHHKYTHTHMCVCIQTYSQCNTTYTYFYCQVNESMK